MNELEQVRRERIDWVQASGHPQWCWPHYRSCIALKSLAKPPISSYQ